MTLITAERMKAFAPSCDYVVFAPSLARAASLKGIDTPHRVAHFLGQLHHESGGFTRLTENLNYSALRLTQVWPSRFPTLKSAEPFARNPEALANKVYGNRHDLGNDKPGDGWKYRGRGLIQLTGRLNYAKAGAWSGFDLLADPDLAAEPATACMIAAAFWDWRKLNALADENDLAAITQLINGGVNGLVDRRLQVERAKVIFS